MKFLTSFVLLFFLQEVNAQNYYSIRGFVQSEYNIPIASVDVRIQNLGLGTVTDKDGKYELKVPEGLHRIHFNYIGFEPQNVDLVVKADHVQNIYLKESIDELEIVEIVQKKKDFSYTVIKKVIENKHKYQNNYQTMRFQAYIKSSETTKNSKKPKKKKIEEDEDPFKLKGGDSLNNMSFFECKLTCHLKRPNYRKEERTAVKKLGDQSNLFYTSTTDGEFNIYNNLMTVGKLGSNSLISPISNAALAAYKYKLLGSYYDSDGAKVYRIKIIPRKMGNAAFSGVLEVYDEIWALKSVKLDVPKNTLILYDKFSFNINYSKIQNHWVIKNQQFEWKVKEGGIIKKGKTIVSFDNFGFDSTYKKRYFNAELGVTTAQAYKRDTSYWDSIRPIPLTLKEIKYISYKDSIYRFMNSSQYLDSIDSVYNKLTFLKIAWFGFGRINRKKKTLLTFAAVINFLDPVAIGGFRIKYSVRFSKRFEDRKQFIIRPFINYGFLNQDFKGSVSTSLLYNPLKLSRLSVNVGKYFGFVNGFATFADMLRRDNFYEMSYAYISHNTELFNGFYMNIGTGVNDRRDLSDFKFAKQGDSLFDNNVAAQFKYNRNLSTSLSFSFTPYQLYLKEPNEKIVLGSRFPTFTAYISKSWDNVFNSTNDYIYNSYSIHQSFNTGIIGSSEYRISTGKFITHKKLAIMDYKYQRGGDSYFFTPPMYTFQLIDSTFTTFNWFLEAHYLHQFNGFLTSKIPFMKKLGIKSMAGAGILYAPEHNYQYNELFYGINRIIKIGRDRLRIGVYYVTAQSNKFGFKSSIKISIEPYNRDKNTWSF